MRGPTSRHMPTTATSMSPLDSATTRPAPSLGDTTREHVHGVSLITPPIELSLVTPLTFMSLVTPHIDMSLVTSLIDVSLVTPPIDVSLVTPHWCVTCHSPY